MRGNIFGVRDNECAKAYHSVKRSNELFGHNVIAVRRLALVQLAACHNEQSKVDEAMRVCIDCFICCIVCIVFIRFSFKPAPLVSSNTYFLTLSDVCGT